MLVLGGDNETFKPIDVTHTNIFSFRYKYKGNINKLIKSINVSVIGYKN